MGNIVYGDLIGINIPLFSTYHPPASLKGNGARQHLCTLWGKVKLWSNFAKKSPTAANLIYFHAKV